MTKPDTSVITERGINQLSHPNPHVRGRLTEVRLSDCRSGCKIYEDPKTGELILSHSATYGCNKTKRVLEKASEAEFSELFAGRTYWMVPMRDKLDPNLVFRITAAFGLNALSKSAKQSSVAIHGAGMAAKDAATSMKSLLKQE